MEKIKVENLSFKYPASSAYALNNVDFTVNRGEFVVICGKSGCGKSTLLRCLKPIIAPCGELCGKIFFDEIDVRNFTQRQQAEQIGFVMQNADSQIVCDKVWHELAFGLESLGLKKDEIRTRTAETASFFGIQNWFHKNVNELSGGQKQLLNLASVMVMQPQVLILDEPTSQLDPIAAHDFLETVHRINVELGTTIILSEHRLEEAVPLSDKVIVMENGLITACGKPQNVGELLKNNGNEMLDAFPTPIKIYYKSGMNGDCPITVREGKNMLEKANLKSNCLFIDDVNSKKPKKQVALELRDVWFRYEKNHDDVLKGLNFKAYEGELYAIVGGNGTGKTTALSLIAGINTPYCGKIIVSDNKKVGVLPQNPQNLFCNKSVALDLKDALKELDLSVAEKEERLNYVLNFCELNSVSEKHPYDLSGGEQQRVALALILLQNPDILVLDEPTKGLDAHFKKKLAVLIKQLKKSGVAVIMVSHDIEFCANYADRCGMFFDGKIVSQDFPREFFDGKTFYTTAANRMAKTTIKGAVTESDILNALGVKEAEPENIENFEKYSKPVVDTDNKAEHTKRKIGLKNILCGIVFFALFFMVQFLLSDEDNTLKKSFLQILGIIFLTICGINFVPKKEFSQQEFAVAEEKQKISKQRILSTLIILIFIPITIFVGVKFLGDRKYYFISLLIIFELMLPFILIFEGKKNSARKLVVISILCALAIAGRIVFAPFPEFKPVVALIIISAACLGGETGFIIGAVTGFVSNFFFGQGPWTPWQMFSFGIIGFLAGILFNRKILGKSKINFCVFGFFATFIIYGGIMNPASVIMYQPNPTFEMLIASYLPGLPVDLVHAVSTVFFLGFAAEPMCEKLERIKIKYELYE